MIINYKKKIFEYNYYRTFPYFFMNNHLLIPFDNHMQFKCININNYLNFVSLFLNT